jgi:hypothetical protein
VSDQPSPDASGSELEVRRLRAANARLREVMTSKDALLAGKDTLIEAQREQLGNWGCR